MNQLALSLAGSIALSGALASAQQTTDAIGRFDARNITYLGTIDAVTGQLTPPGVDGTGLGDPIYANNSLPGTFFNIEGSAGAGGLIIDEGRVPGPTSTNVVGTQESYALTSMQIAYVTNATDPSMGGTGVTLELQIFENFAPCGNLETTDAPIATIVLAGLAGSTTGGFAGQLLDVDLNGLGICLRADGGDDYSNGTDDLFGWSMRFVDNGDGTGGGPFIASRPLTHPAGDGTVFQNPGVPGSGLDTQDLWRQISGSGVSNCFFFGGYPGAAFGSFYMVVRSDLAGDCIGCGIGDDRFEPNDDAAGAVPIPLDNYGGLISNPEEDWFLVTVPPNSALVADLLFVDAISDLDLILIDPVSGSNIDTGFTTSDNERCFAPNCDPMNSIDVLVRVDNFSNVCNDYDLNLNLDPLFADDGLEENDSCAMAVPMPIGVTGGLIVRPYCGIGTTIDDSDYYSHTLMPGDSLTVDVLFTDAIADIDLVIYDITAGCNGTTLVTGFTTTDNENGVVTNSTMAPIELAVRVDFFSGESSTYTLVTKVGPATIGELICLGNDNSVGAGARLCTTGSDVAADDDVTFDVTALPTMSLGYFIVSQDTFLVVNPGGSAGNLCIASYAIGRYAGDILDSGATGTVSFNPSVAVIPIAAGGGSSTSAAMTGDTYNWQYWYRDVDGMGVPTSNFSDAVTIGFN